MSFFLNAKFRHWLPVAFALSKGLFSAKGFFGVIQFRGFTLSKGII